MSKKRIGILTGGGDVPPLNAVIYSAREEAEKNNIELVGFLKGWDGILEKNCIVLNHVNINPGIGGTILKSSRVNIAKIENGPEKVLKNLNDLNISGLIVIGGEDTLSNSLYIKNFPQVLISKTIDNDVGILKENSAGSLDIVNYFTLGYPSAAENISNFVSLSEGLRTTAYSHERIIIVESMGMHAGWLALSSSAGYPDFIIIPEFPVDYNLLKDKIAGRYLKVKNVIVVIAEGARWINGNYISADAGDKDSFGHPKFKGAAELLAKMLKEDLKKYFDTRNVNAVNPSYLYRSGRPNDLDLNTAKLLGKNAVNLFIAGLDKCVFESVQFKEGSVYADNYEFSGLNNIEEFHRFVINKFYDAGNFTATEEAVKYLSIIVPALNKDNYGLSDNNINFDRMDR
jgi:6-phosphofructokinase 1